MAQICLIPVEKAGRCYSYSARGTPWMRRDFLPKGHNHFTMNDEPGYLSKLKTVETVLCLICTITTSTFTNY